MVRLGAFKLLDINCSIFYFFNLFSFLPNMYSKKDVNAYQTSTMKNSHFFSTDETFVVLLLPAK